MAKDMETASKIALEAGNDMIMTTPEFYRATLTLLERGEVDMAHIDEAVRRVLGIKFAAGLFDNPDKIKTLPLAEDPRAKAVITSYSIHYTKLYEADLRLNAEGTPLDLTLFSVRYRY